jgi:hypothetical protein
MQQNARGACAVAGHCGSYLAWTTTTLRARDIILSRTAVRVESPAVGSAMEPLHHLGVSIPSGC